MKILIVGAGAVGKIYGKILQNSGAEITFFVKEKYVAAAKSGYTLYPVNQGRKASVHWNQFQVISEIAAVAEKKWDYVILAMSSTALQGVWLDEMIKAMGNATLVTLQPGMNDREYLLTKISAARLIDGTIPIVSYEAPLPGENRFPGTVYWIPSGAVVALSGPSSETSLLVKAFNRGGLAAKTVSDARKENIAAGPVLTLFVAALEREKWSFKRLKKSPVLKIACAAMTEAIRVQAKKAGVSPPRIGWILKPALFRGIMTVSRILVPFDFETYLRVHFTKVGEQMHSNLNQMIEYGKKEGLPVARLQELNGINIPAL